MKTPVHLLISLIIAVAFYPLHSWKVVFIIVGGVLIDIDHYFWYVYKYKELSIIKSYKFYIKNINENNFSNVFGILLAFHTIEFLLLMLALSFYNQFVLIFTIGLLSHYVLDLIYLCFIPKRLIVNHSIIYWVFKNKIQKV